MRKGTRVGAVGVSSDGIVEPDSGVGALGDEGRLDADGEHIVVVRGEDGNGNVVGRGGGDGVEGAGASSGTSAIGARGARGTGAVGL